MRLLQCLSSFVKTGSMVAAYHYVHFISIIPAPDIANWVLDLDSSRTWCSLIQVYSWLYELVMVREFLFLTPMMNYYCYSMWKGKYPTQMFLDCWGLRSFLQLRREKRTEKECIGDYHLCCDCEYILNLRNWGIMAGFQWRRIFESCSCRCHGYQPLVQTKALCKHTHVPSSRYEIIVIMADVLAMCVKSVLLQTPECSEYNPFA